MKKILFTILLLAAAINSYAYDFSAVCSTGQMLYYNITSDSTVEVTYCSRGQYSGGYACSGEYYYYPTLSTKPTGYLIIPDTVSYNGIIYLVNRIGNSAFSQCDGLTGVYIGNQVIEIGSFAFNACYSLRNVHISYSVTHIGSCAFSGAGVNYLFYDCPNVIHPTGVGEIPTSEPIAGSIISALHEYCHRYALCNPFASLLGRTNLTIEFGPHISTIPRGLLYRGQYSVGTYQGQYTWPESYCMADTIILGMGIEKISDSLFAGLQFSTIVFSSPIDSIGNYAFLNCNRLSHVSLPDSLSYIGEYAFMNCDSLSGCIRFSPNMETIADGVFYNCAMIDSLIFCEGLRIIGTSAFAGCNSLKSLVIPNSVTDIGSNAFYGCSGIDSLYLNSGLQTIGAGAFSGCTGLKYMYYNVRNCGTSLFASGDNAPFANTTTNQFTTLVIGDSIGAIPDSCFFGCSSIDSLYIGSGVTSIGSSAFSGCSSIHRLVIPNNVTSIGQEAFYGCTGADSLYIGSGVQSTGAKAFSGCTDLKYLFYNARNCNALFATGSTSPFYNTSTPLFTTLVVGDSVETIPSNAFYNRSCINSVHIGTSVHTIGNNAFRGCGGIDQLIIPDNVTSIGDYAFYGCSGIDSLNIGNGITAIGTSVFQGCSGIHHLIIPNGVISIGDNAFYGCTGINILHIGNGLTTIDNNAFQGCSSIHQLVIPNNVTSIGSNAFYGCTGIDSLHFGSGLTVIGNNAFHNCSGIQNLVIPGNISSIGNNAFYGCSSIENISFGNGVESIGNSAFQSCNGFTKLAIPASVTSIGSNAFYGCVGIDSLYIGSGVQTMGSGAFRGCTGLQWLNYNAPNLPAQGFYGCTQLAALILGNNVQSIGGEAFYNCDNLLSASISANQIGNNAFANCDRLVSVTLGESTNTIGNGVFSGCFRLQNIDLGGVTAIGDNAFDGCVRLERPELPANLTTIGTRAFNGCSLLAGKLTFPATITSIGDYAYSGVGTITEIEMLGANPPTIYAHTFASVSSSTPVSVPCGAVLNYYTTNYWENFSTIVEAPPFKLSVSSNNEVMGIVAITQQPTCNNYTARISATAEAGYHFLQWNDGNTTNPRQISMTQDSSFVAIFVVNNSYITVEANDPIMGTVSGTGNYSYNAPVTLTATAYDGYHFLKWNDGNTSNPRYMAAICDTSFTAIFVSNVSTITVSNANPDWGNVSGSGVYYYQNLVSLTATPNYGYHFSQWQDGNTQNPRTITISQDSTFTAYFAVNTYSIVASSNSTTMGSVSGGGTYTYLHEMSLTATPAYGYHFVQWNDQNTDNPRTITVTKDSAFTAQFAANSYVITAEPNDPTMGSAYGSGTYNYNTTATLTAVETYGYHFTQWSDGVTDNPRSVTVQNSATYTAQFEINSYILTVQSSNPAIGTTSGGGSYNYLTPVNITANPNAGYHFTQWSDGNTDNPRLVTVTQNATYTAQFAINSYAVGVASSNSNMGSVSGSGTYNHNSTATLTATPYYGYHFVQWQDGNTENPRSVVVTDSAQYTAQFDYNSYLVTANSSNVTLGSATGGGSYNYLSQVALTAVAVPHYHFTMWNDSIEDNPRTIIVTRDTMFTAHFAIDRHTIGVNSADVVMGSASGSDTVNYNTAVWITATANYGYHFVQWNDGNSSNPRRVVVSQDTAFTASFAPNQYTATTAVNDAVMGCVTAGGTYSYLTPLTMTATANYGYHFSGWSDGVTENPRTFTLTQDTSFTAVFAVNQYYVTLGSNDSTLGTVQGSGEYDYLSQVTITATAAPHSHFVQWNDGNTTNPRLLTLTCDTSFTALFEQDQQYHITVCANDTTRGSVEGSGTYYLGETVTLTATANEHYYFSQWSDGNTSNPRVVTVAGDASYTAVFEPIMYTVTVEANNYSMGQVVGGGSYAYGSEVTIEARAFGGYRFTGWSDGVTEEQRTVTVTEDASYMALFEPNVGIGEVDGASYRVYVSNGRIIVEGLESARVQIYDVSGRRHSHNEQLPMGVYMVRIDNVVTKKVVVM